MSEGFLDPLIHERARLLILTGLLQAENGRLSFSKLKELTGLSSGNLWVQIKRLEEGGYLSVEAVSPRLTEILLTEKGMNALDKYFQDIQRLFRKDGTQ
ncbi:MAG: transcriptional regulator [Brevinematales bacterium]|nr:transcriptional regulator [Brevinematales bacterium]